MRFLQVSLTAATSDLLNQEVLLAGVALNHTFHGLAAGAEYTISVTAATDARLGQQATITIATVATPQSLETIISTPGMYGPCLCNITLLYCVCLSLIVLHTVCNHYCFILPLLYSCRLCAWHTDSSCACTGTCSLHKVSIQS